MHHGPMPRSPRDDVAGAIQHAIARSSGGESIVIDDRDRTELMSRIGAAIGRHRWSCLAYCVMSTHFHLLVGTPAPTLGVGMQWLLASYARYFNKRHQRAGNLFHSRFYSARIKSEEHLISAMVYVLLNPVEPVSSSVLSTGAGAVTRRPSERSRRRTSSTRTRLWN